MRGNGASRLAAALAVALVAAACTDDGGTRSGTAPATTTRLLDAPRLRVCLDPARQPYTVEDPDGPGGLGGLDVELLVLVAAELDAQLVVRPTVDVELAAALAARQCDLAGGGTPLAQVDARSATRAYTRGALVLVVRPDRADTIASAEDLDGRRVAVLAGSPAHRFVLTMPRVGAVVAVDSTVAALEAVEERRAEAAVVDRDDAAAPLRSHDGLTAVASVALGDAVVFVVRAASLRQDVDDALAVLIDRGAVERLEQQWAGPAAAPGAADARTGDP